VIGFSHPSLQMNPFTPCHHRTLPKRIRTHCPNRGFEWTFSVNHINIKQINSILDLSVITHPGMSFRENLPSTADVRSAASAAASQAADAGLQASAIVSSKALEAADAARGPLAYVRHLTQSTQGSPGGGSCASLSVRLGECVSCGELHRRTGAAVARDCSALHT
jgi:hypothetical protein